MNQPDLRSPGAKPAPDEPALDVEDRTAGDPAVAEAIGRPAEWGEGRYEKPGAPLEESVVRQPGEDFAPDATVSTPVTQKDYRTRPSLQRGQRG